MSYIGRQISNLSDRVKLDSITTSATATYNLLLNTVAYVPSSAESLTVSLNGVIQAPQDSYTVSGSTITFSSTLSASDSIDFILAERSITLQTPSAGSVGTSQLAADAVNGDKIADDSISDEHLDITAITGQTEKTSLADADKFLISDSAASGALKYVQKSNLPSGGLVHITSQAFPSANNFTIDSVFSADYVNYIMMINMLNCTTDDSLDFVFVKSGTPDTGTRYRYTVKGYSNSGSNSDSVSNGSTTFGKLIHDMDADSEAGASGTFTIFSPFAAYQRKHVSGLVAVQKNTANNTAPYYLASDYHNGTTQQFTGIKFQTTIGHNFRAGSVSGGYSSVSIYGVKNS